MSPTYNEFTYYNKINKQQNNKILLKLQKTADQAISKADYKAASKPLLANLKILDVFSIYSFQLSSFKYLYHNDAFFNSNLSNWEPDSSIFNKIL